MSDDRTAHSRLLAVAIDARHPEALAQFWCAVLGSSVVDRKDDAHGTRYVDVALQPGMVRLFQQVPEDKAGKNRAPPRVRDEIHAPSRTARARGRVADAL